MIETQIEKMKEVVGEKTTTCIIKKALNRDNKTLLKTIYSETYNLNKVRYLCGLEEAEFVSKFWDPEELNQSGELWDMDKYIKNVRTGLNTILKKARKDNVTGEFISIERRYKRTKHGRLFVIGFGLQSCQNKLRKFLSGDSTFDIDMCKCHWQILVRLCEIHDIPCKKIKYFLNNYNKIIAEAGIEKQDLLVMLYIDNYKSNNDVLNKLHKCKSIIFEELIDTPHFKSLKLKPSDKSKKDKNVISSLAAQYFQHLECEILIAVCNKYPDEIEVLMFDGFQPKKTIDVDVLLKELKILTGFDWSQKDNIYEIEGWENEELTDYMTWAEQFEEHHFILNNPFEYYKKTEQGLVSYNKTNFKDKYEYQLENINLWLKDEARRTYDSFTMMPYQKGYKDPAPENQYNKWKEYDAEIVPLPKNYEPVEVMDLLCQSLCWDEDENERIRQSAWVMNYLAFHIQYPEIKTQVGLVFESTPGCGKDLLMNIIQKMLGKHAVIITENPNDLFIGMKSGDNFNKDIEGKKMIVLNEAIGGDIVQLMDKIKSHITSQTVNINRKNRETYEIPDFSSFISMTNNVFPIEWHDRRFVKVQGRNWTVIPQEEKDEFFPPKWEILNNQHEINMFFTYLSKRDLGDWEPRKNRLITKSYQQAKKSKHKNTSQFLLEIFNDDWIELTRYEGNDNLRYMIATEFRDNYLKWLKHTKNKSTAENTKMTHVYSDLENAGVKRSPNAIQTNQGRKKVVFFDIPVIIENLKAIGILEN